VPRLWRSHGGSGAGAIIIGFQPSPSGWVDGLAVGPPGLDVVWSQSQPFYPKESILDRSFGLCGAECLVASFGFRICGVEAG
jgi:hypothetical protein